MHRPLVGRGRELSTLSDALDRARSGRGGVLRILGEPGAGKTRLADALAELARERDARVGWARSWDGAGPYGVVLEALRSARSDLRAVPASPRSRDETFEALRAAVEVVGPSLLVLDDLHGADLDSLAFVRWLSPRLRNTSALLVATERSVATGASPEATALLAEIAREAGTVALAGLDPAAVGELIAATTGRVADPRMAEAVQRATLGNALFVDGVLRDAARTGSLDVGTLSFPRDLQHAVALRVGAAGPDAALALGAAALLTRPFALALLGEVVELPRPRLLAALDRALDEGLVTAAPAQRFAFCHPLFAAGVAASLSSLDRARLHARIADAVEAVEGRAAAPSELAHHRALSAPAVGHGPGLAACERAADHAAALHAHGAATAHRRAALDLLETHAPSDRAARLRVTLALGDDLLRAGRRGDARAALVDAASLARSLADPDGLARAALALADTGEFGARDPLKLAVLDEALAAAGDAPSHNRARLLAGLGAELWVEPAQSDRGDALTAEALRVARALDDDALLQDVLDGRFQSIWGPTHLTERLALADELSAIALRRADVEARLTAHRRRMLVAIETGDVRRFAAEVEAYAVLAAPLDRPSLDDTLAQRRGLLAMVAGDLDLARRRLDEWYGHALRSQNPQAEMGRRFVASEILLQAGDRVGLKALLTEMEADADRLANLPFVRARCAQVAARVGDEPAARRHLDRFVRSANLGLGNNLVTLAALAFAAEAASTLHDVASCEVLLPLLAPYAHLVASVAASVCVGSVSHFLGLLLMETGAPDRAAAHLDAALAVHRAMESPPLIAATMEALSRVGASPVVASGPATRARLARTEGGWRLEWRGRGSTLRALKGIDLVAALLAHPGVERHVLDLMGAGELREASGQTDAPRLDVRAKADYRARVLTLRAREDDAAERGDDRAAARARAEREAIEDELRGALGLGGRARVGGAAERARVTVAKALRRALDAVATAEPEAAAHLERSLRTGFACAYDPDPSSPVEWVVEG